MSVPSPTARLSPAGCFVLPLALLAVVLAGCGSPDASVPAAAAAPAEAHDHDHAGHDHDHGGSAIAVPALVRENLGITFATAGYRVVQGVQRLPGRFEAEPAARHAHQMPLAGRVEVLVRPYQRVAVGEPLFRIAAADWHDLQRDLADAMLAERLAGARLTAAEAEAVALAQAGGRWRDRATTLRQLMAEIGGNSFDLAEAESRAAELLAQEAIVRARIVELRAQAIGLPQAGEGDATPATGLAAIRLRHLLVQASRITGLDPAALTAAVDGRPRWQAIDAPLVTARTAGVVEGEIASDGAWLDEHATVVTVSDPAGVRLRASAPQADLPRLRDGLPARIVGLDARDPWQTQASMVLAPQADPLDRSLELIARQLPGASLPAGVRPGVLALLEVAVSGSADEELAIPLSATTRDGLDTVFFKRHRDQPDVVEKVVADLGANDGRWVVVESGLAEGDEVVVGGLYPLVLSQQAGGAAAGHFEADGTFHTGKH